MSSTYFPGYILSNETNTVGQSNYEGKWDFKAPKVFTHTHHVKNTILRLSKITYNNLSNKYDHTTVVIGGKPNKIHKE